MRGGKGMARVAGMTDPKNPRPLHLARILAANASAANAEASSAARCDSPLSEDDENIIASSAFRKWARANASTLEHYHHVGPQDASYETMALCIQINSKHAQFFGFLNADRETLRGKYAVKDEPPAMPSATSSDAAPPDAGLTLLEFRNKYHRDLFAAFQVSVYGLRDAAVLAVAKKNGKLSEIKPSQRETRDVGLTLSEIRDLYREELYSRFGNPLLVSNTLLLAWLKETGRLDEIQPDLLAPDTEKPCSSCGKVHPKLPIGIQILLDILKRGKSGGERPSEAGKGEGAAPDPKAKRCEFCGGDHETPDIARFLREHPPFRAPARSSWARELDADFLRTWGMPMGPMPFEDVTYALARGSGADPKPATWTFPFLDEKGSAIGRAYGAVLTDYAPTTGPRGTLFNVGDLEHRLQHDQLILCFGKVGGGGIVPAMAQAFAADVEATILQRANVYRARRPSLVSRVDELATLRRLAIDYAIGRLALLHPDVLRFDGQALLDEVADDFELLFGEG